MQKTIVLLLFLFVISGGLFSACNGVKEELNQPAVEVTAPVVETEEETDLEEETEPEEKTEVKKSKMKVSVDVSDSSKEPVVTTKYVDGSYSQNGGYTSPAGPETISVSVTVKDDVVTAVTVTPMAVNENSQKFQGLFAEGISSMVVGKKIDEIGGFAQVNGSSLSPQGFDVALTAIKSGAVN